MNQKQTILDYLENAYTEAKMADDVEMMCRLAKAIIVFSYDNFMETPDWDKMINAYAEN